MFRRIPVIAVLALLAKPAFAQRVENPTAEFAGLDKITARIIKFDVRINETVQFGALQVTPRVCNNRAEADDPLTTGFVEVDELTLDNKIHRIFSGWMFADSPGLNAVEHPIYDIWLVSCKGGARPQAPVQETPLVEEVPKAKKKPRAQQPVPDEQDREFLPDDGPDGGYERPRQRIEPGEPFDPDQLPAD